MSIYLLFVTPNNQTLVKCPISRYRDVSNCARPRVEHQHGVCFTGSVAHALPRRRGTHTIPSSSHSNSHYATPASIALTTSDHKWLEANLNPQMDF